MATRVRTDRHGTVALLTLDHPPVNALSDALRSALDVHVRTALDDPSVAALVITGAGRAFVAGADIREFEQMHPEAPPAACLGELLNLIERAPKPVVMAINGVAFGGGLELAMAGHYRLASPSAQVGQPEVKLGLVPGAGGTQRLPRLAGPRVAAHLCAFGEPVSAPSACADGILDRVVDSDLLTAAIEFAAEAARRPIPRTRDRLERLGSPGQHAAMFAEVRALAARRMKGQTAPLLAVDLVEAATTLPFDAGCAREREAFRRCLAGAQSRALIHVFFGERVVSKVPGVPVAPEPLPIRTVAVVGAGTMGRGIAMCYAHAGIPVVLKESTAQALDHGLQAIRHTYASAVTKGRLAQAEADRRLARVTPTMSYDQFHEADLVVEAVFEEIEVKERVFAELEATTRPDAILATNTSYLDVDRIAAATSRPARVVGHHFFSPAHVMRLLEIVRGRETAPEILRVSLALARRLGKIGVVVGNGRGFVGNRLYEPFVRESVFLVEEGVEPERLDRALTDFGMAMGPLAVQDLSGLDVGWRIRKAFAHLRVPGARTPFANDLLCEMGRFGQKTGAGWYRYDAERRAKVDAGIVGLLRAAARERGIPQREVEDQEIVDRLVLSLVNEGARALEEGVALRAVDIDIIYINGYGFPAWRGGPMKYADLTGLGPVLDRIREFQERDPHHWQAAPLLERLARDGHSFTAFDLERAR
jgi:3-hydroxyacyl-CoA dehydrogenase